MEYDRTAVKQAAKDAVRRGDPKPWLVTLVYYLVAMIPGFVLYFVILLSDVPYSYGYAYGRYGYDGFPSLILLFLSIAFSLFSAVFQAGYTHYSMNLWRGRRTEVKDLFQCFHMAGKVICLYLLQSLFTFLWALLAGLALSVPIAVLGWFFGSKSPIFLLSLLGTVGLMAFLFNRILRYSLAFYVLLDHPDWRALDCLNESKALMLGRRCSFLLLCLSFLGWGLLVLVIIYGALIAGAFVGTLIGVFAAPYIGYYAIILWIFLVVIAAFLAGIFCAAPLLLWLLPYFSTAKAGFYDCAAGYGQPLVEPTPPAGPYQRLGDGPTPDTPHFYHYGASSDREPPPPPADTPRPEDGNAHTGNFYSGFVQKEPEHKPEQHDSDSDM